MKGIAMRSRWSDMLAVVGMALVAGLGAGCDCTQVRTDNEGLKKQLESLTGKQNQTQRENMRLTQGAKQHQAQLKAANDRAKKAGTDAARAKAELAALKGKMAPKPAPPIRIPGVDVKHEGDRIRLSISATTLFSPGKTQLTRKARSTLVRVAQKLNSPAFKNRLIGVEGHTDADPIRKTAKLYKDNHDLAVQRARAVFEYLVTTGKVARIRLFVAGYGPNTPVLPNATATGKAKNRRVEVVIYNKMAIVQTPKKR
jgi:chemotaxis protein MotB